MPAGPPIKTKLMTANDNAKLLDKYVWPFVAHCIDNVAIEEIVSCTDLKHNSTSRTGLRSTWSTLLAAQDT